MNDNLRNLCVNLYILNGNVFSAFPMCSIGPTWHFPTSCPSNRKLEKPPVLLAPVSSCLRVKLWLQTFPMMPNPTQPARVNWHYHFFITQIHWHEWASVSWGCFSFCDMNESKWLIWRELVWVLRPFKLRRSEVYAPEFASMNVYGFPSCIMWYLSISCRNTALCVISLLRVGSACVKSSGNVLSGFSVLLLYLLFCFCVCVNSNGL